VSSPALIAIANGLLIALLSSQSEITNQIVTWNDVYINPSRIPWKVKSNLSFQFIKIKRIRDS